MTASSAKDVIVLIAKGESHTLALAHSTAELKRAGVKLSGFMNGNLVTGRAGATHDGKSVGQRVADIALRGSLRGSAWVLETGGAAWVSPGCGRQVGADPAGQRLVVA